MNETDPGNGEGRAEDAASQKQTLSAARLLSRWDFVKAPVSWLNGALPGRPGVRGLALALAGLVAHEFRDPANGKRLGLVFNSQRGKGNILWTGPEVGGLVEASAWTGLKYLHDLEERGVVRVLRRSRGQVILIPDPPQVRRKPGYIHAPGSRFWAYWTRRIPELGELGDSLNHKRVSRGKPSITCERVGENPQSLDTPKTDPGGIEGQPRAPGAIRPNSKVDKSKCRQEEVRYLDPPSVTQEGLTCPRCGEGEVIEMRGRHGTFWGCSAYRDNGCDYKVNARPGLVEVEEGPSYWRPFRG